MTWENILKNEEDMTDDEYRSLYGDGSETDYTNLESHEISEKREKAIEKALREVDDAMIDFYNYYMGKTRKNWPAIGGLDMSTREVLVELLEGWLSDTLKLDEDKRVRPREDKFSQVRRELDRRKGY
jgi:hypothetical protein